MPPAPLYQPNGVNAAYCLRYAWTAWFEPTTQSRAWEAAIDMAAALWPKDGMRLLEKSRSNNQVQLAFSTKPDVSPKLLAMRAKGRLQHALRLCKQPAIFRRNFSVRSVGNNVRLDIDCYIKNQVSAANFCDPRFSSELETLQFFDPRIDLGAPSQNGKGLYWYNLHLVLETVQHEPIRDLITLGKIADAFRKIARAKKHGLAKLSPMPDHFHAALRGRFDQSPAEIALGYLNNIAYLLGQKAILQPSYYAGTFSEYDMGAIRAKAAL